MSLCDHISEVFLDYIELCESSSLPKDSCTSDFFPKFTSFWLGTSVLTNGYDEKRNVDEVLKLFLVILYMWLYVVMGCFSLVFGDLESLLDHICNCVSLDEREYVLRTILDNFILMQTSLYM